jgi:two-component system, OmpR family, response regulator VicR
MEKCILIVEDDAPLARVLRDTLTFEGYSVHVAPSVRVATQKLRDVSPDLVLLDVMLPDGDGFELCASLRQRSDTAVILLTARSQKTDKLTGLALGADDYVTKPFDLEELVARIHSVLRRLHPHSGVLMLGSVIVNFHTLRATDGGREIHLTHREFAILQYLAERRTQIVSRDELLSKVWSYEDLPITRSVDQAIMRLRKKIEHDPRSPRFIHSVHGHGYCLTPDGSSDIPRA